MAPSVSAASVNQRGGKGDASCVGPWIVGIMKSFGTDEKTTFLLGRSPSAPSSQPALFGDVTAIMAILAGNGLSLLGYCRS